jgi:hypothetical protein
MVTRGEFIDLVARTSVHLVALLEQLKVASGNMGGYGLGYDKLETIFIKRKIELFTIAQGELHTLATVLIEADIRCQQDKDPEPGEVI